jgi:hypothetical protein
LGAIVLGVPFSVVRFRSGHAWESLVEGHLVEQTASGAVARMAVAAGPARSFAPGRRGTPGQIFPAIIGDGTSTHAIVETGLRRLERSSLLTEEESVPAPGPGDTRAVGSRSVTARSS